MLAFLPLLFIYFGLLKDAVSSSDYRLQRRMIGLMNWKGYGKKPSWPNLRYYPGIFQEEMRKATKSLMIASSGPVFIPGSPDNETGQLTNRPLRSVLSLVSASSYRPKSCSYPSDIHPVWPRTASGESHDVSYTAIQYSTSELSNWRPLSGISAARECSYDFFIFKNK
jgi:hypothetical protein